MRFSLNYSTVWERFVAWYQGSWVDKVFTFLGERVFAVSFSEYSKIPLSPTAGKTARNWILSFLVAFWVAAVVMVFVKAVPGGLIRRLLAMGATDAEHAVTLAEAGYPKNAAVRYDLSRGGALAKLLARPGDGEKTVAGTPIPDVSVETDPETGEARPSLVERLSTPEKTAPSTPENAEPAVVSAPAPAENAEPAEEPAPSEATEAVSDKAPATAPLNFETDRFYIPKALCDRAGFRFANRGSGILAAALSIVGSTLVAFVLCGVIPLLFRLANWILGG